MYNKITKVAPVLLQKSELSSVISSLNGWKLNENNTIIHKQYKLKDFEQTWGFLNQVSLRSHLWGHHPEILTVYNKVEIRLSTHDLGGVSDIDIKLAKKIDGYRDKYDPTT